ncbi:hypothetical protein [Mangrovicoccus sp. HB161399]|uniref:hypothetical protein n=1 Tax=Mangrovicoccus sp. HB161399 TaxID=2720392 RepID=UPI001557671E|nr:hypothetical protein [Mangrovicoccus sp. HB161399]
MKKTASALALAAAPAASGACAAMPELPAEQTAATEDGMLAAIAAAWPVWPWRH